MFNGSAKRLNKFISESGICSRREADRFIEQGNVFINGKRAQIGDQVHPGDQVRVNGQMIDPPEPDDFVFIALNKPVGIESTTESSRPNNIVDFVNHGVRIFPIGRLDKDSQGLIFMTNNGDLVNKVLRAGNNHEKEYVVTVNKPITPAFIEGMAGGVPILGTMTKKCPVKKLDTRVFNITLVQGLNRQIRRMCEHFGYEVVKLERTRIMNVDLKGLALGDWRDLTQKELTTLLKSVEHSSSEAKPGTRKSRSPNRSKPSQSTHKKGHANRNSHGEGKKPNSNGPKRNAAGKPIVRKPTTKHPDRGAKRGGAAKSGKSSSGSGGRARKR
ncbi:MULTISPECIES: 23S rRNA pseudouridine(2604) synthase RluF [unclassified Marinobacterium]|jgi:23S rRNA pseudouridine2604 synthase|uniref:23S rRNA pseudouridine(2604) synthase RluF n=1 Tax=unclassified Marinobacterium TaxID=2644139 RepID=UPI00156870FF|nr:MULTISPECIES: 23S rRNA pseudouridine(2604) synthase RluF [unclassified Marinobacterium]NRP14849.1 Ribosomal large subunit pseudouridine synthase F [Marinobacterium sp. xm-a-152]NRP36792.1 Ribosomal large subunit pseudouridine synthase F [Marinobacterium sp. xm-d-579]NRP46691.1 Ribosomal large subunit pseudouridine synthase F [Marinobacterium sp. xm-d-543]NRP58102.1 Ribosomal large subunit pseudouridine synthase F [Marinobacterium sp. xm-d-510]NRP94952.1 Ribosomal large subunit pseudouridine